MEREINSLVQMQNDYANRKAFKIMAYNPSTQDNWLFPITNIISRLCSKTNLSFRFVSYVPS